MQLTRWAQIAELVSSVAVLITLVILVFEIRNNSSAIRSEAYGNSIELVNQWRFETTSNPDLARLYRIYTQEDVSELNPDELLQLNFYLGGLWSIYESAYFARGYDTLGLSEWDRFEIQICEQYNFSTKQNVWEGTASRMTQDFRNYVVSFCTN